MSKVHNNILIGNKDNKKVKWLISADSKVYDHASSFEHFGFIDWKQNNCKFEVDDIVYIYCTAPLSKIQYKTKVEKVNLTFDEIRDDKEYWHNIDKYLKSKSGKYMRLAILEQIDNPDLSLSILKENGLRCAPQGPKKISGMILDYIEKNFTDNNQNNLYPELLDQSQNIYEGIKKQVFVNKYERSSIARSKCIEHHGTTCKVCNMDFFKIYGEIGKNFIHVHHIVPISKISKTYKVDFINDLIPVCPNCHAMLHKKKSDGTEVSIQYLKDILNNMHK